MRSFVLLLFCISLLSAYAYEPRIINGTRSEIEAFPYQVSFQVFETHLCGAAILNSRTILTAAHCVKNAKFWFATSWFVAVVAGVSVLFTAGGQTVQVAQIYDHPQYDRRTSDYDVCVLKLASDLVFNERVQPIALARERPPVGSIAVVAGWGRTGRVEKERRLMELPVPVLSQDICKQSYPNEMITERMFCAGYLEGGRDTCQGDSGGPLVYNNTVVGIVSWGYKCAERGHPGVFTDVSKFVDFIEKYLN